MLHQLFEHLFIYTSGTFGALADLMLTAFTASQPLGDTEKAEVGYRVSTKWLKLTNYQVEVECFILTGTHTLLPSQIL